MWAKTLGVFSAPSFTTHYGRDLKAKKTSMAHPDHVWKMTTFATERSGGKERQTVLFPTTLSCDMNWGNLSHRPLGFWMKDWNKTAKCCEKNSIRNVCTSIKKNYRCPNYFNHMTFTVLWKKQLGYLESWFKLSHCAVLIVIDFSLVSPPSEFICNKNKLTESLDFTHPQCFSVTTVEIVNRWRKKIFFPTGHSHIVLQRAPMNEWQMAIQRVAKHH